MGIVDDCRRGTRVLQSLSFSCNSHLNLELVFVFAIKQGISFKLF